MTKFFIFTRRGAIISVTEVEVDLNDTQNPAAAVLAHAINLLTAAGAVYLDTKKVS
jgi:hypothetical protein